MKDKMTNRELRAAIERMRFSTKPRDVEERKRLKRILEAREDKERAEKNARNFILWIPWNKLSLGSSVE